MADTTLEDGGDLWLPSEFPYEYGSVDSSPSSVLSSPVESPPVSSTESESDGDEFLAGLTRRFSQSSLHPPQKIPYSQPNLEKPAVLFGSPESTLMAVGSWSVGSQGSPTAPFQFPVSPLVQNNRAWDLSHAVHHGVLPIHPSQLAKNPAAAVACTHRCFSSTLPQPNHIKQVRVRQDQMEKQQSVSCGGFTQSPWPNRQIQHHNQPQNYNGFVPKAVFVGGSDNNNNNNNNNGVKKSGCAGTGVFLPRIYVNPKESRKKPGLWTPPRARVSQPVQNKNFNAIDAHQVRPCFSASFIPHHDNLMNRGNAVLLQQKASLPQDWTY